MKRALVLGGGGARGAFQVGMLEQLVCHGGLDFQVLRGVSVGALNAAFLAQASVRGNSLANLQEKVRELKRLWTEAIEGNHSVYGQRAGGLAALAAGADSLYTVEPLKALIRAHLDLAALRASGRDFAVGTVSLVSGQYQEWTPQDAQFLDKLLASTAIPVVFPYVDTGEDVVVDGGVRDITPLGSAFATGAEEIYVLLTSRIMPEADGSLPRSTVPVHSYRQWSDNWLGTKVGAFDVLKRVVEILTDEIYLGDIRGALEWNRILTAVQQALAGLRGNRRRALEQALAAVGKRPVPVKVLAPRIWYGTDNSSTNFHPQLIAQAIAHGREVAANPHLWLLA
ncbi:MAG: patatin-like phospholipase family protein [Thermoanaerobaculum sp.]|nr:patatin-like phospholipase family protein [Thermoanaerobaculum sp.]MDW7966887.1 patatin-like phospholipase family protein [Thermoanaerobaculum sp.]